MTAKLTKWMRETIANDLVKHRFATEAAKLVSDRAALALDVYNDLYSVSDRKKMDALPEGWLPVDSDLYVQFGASYESVRFNGSIYGEVAKVLEDAVDAVNRRVHAIHVRGCVKVYEATHPFSERHFRLKGRAEDMSKAIDAARRQAEAALAKATTVGKLVELWPEVAPFVAKYANEVKPQLPALPTSELNALLDLPVEEAA